MKLSYSCPTFGFLSISPCPTLILFNYSCLKYNGLKLWLFDEDFRSDFSWYFISHLITPFYFISFIRVLRAIYCWYSIQYIIQQLSYRLKTMRRYSIRNIFGKRFCSRLRLSFFTPPALVTCYAAKNVNQNQNSSSVDQIFFKIIIYMPIIHWFQIKRAWK